MTYPPIGTRIDVSTDNSYIVTHTMPSIGMVNLLQTYSGRTVGLPITHYIFDRHHATA